MIDGKLLDQAVVNVARQKFYSQLREAMVFANVELSFVFSEYLKLVEDNKHDDDDKQDWY
jgi:hypothetical protein